MGGINQIGKEVVTFHFRLRWVHYGKICRHLGIRVRKHSGVSPLTGKESKSKKSTGVKDHMLFWDHVVFIDDFFYVKVKESLLISHDEPILKQKRNVTTSLPIWLIPFIRNYLTSKYSMPFCSISDIIQPR